ncbi:PKD domain-containing protein [Pontiellaceae bacterium B12227]|nr:PKD domain-containing protein [Pontiellaceae bacterium B12227]
MKAKIVSAIAVLAITMMSHGATYTWNGSAADGDWTNASNWDTNGIPASLTATSTDEDTIIFDGANMPTANLATFTDLNWGYDSATLIFNSGGTFELDMSTSRNAAPIMSENRTFLTVGDGTGPTNDVIVNISNMAMLSRHSNVTADYTVNSDGVLNFDGNLETYQQDTKKASFTIHGGTVSAAGYVGTGTMALESIEFAALDAAFTAEIGGEFSDFAAVQADANGLFINNSGGVLEFTTNGTHFTVRAVFSALTPVINVSTNAGVLPLEVVFDGSGSTPSEDIVAYNWDFGDGNTNSGGVVTNTYTTDGEFVATLTVLDASSNSMSTTVSIDVIGPATNITLVADSTSSSTAFYGSSVEKLLTDTFEYDPMDPTATLPSLVFSDGFHGNDASGTNILSFTLSNAYTTVSAYPVIGVDLWGRNSNFDRDDNFDVILYNGDYFTEVGRVEGIAIPDSAVEPYTRALIDTLAVGTTFDRMQIIGHHAQFTLTEVRLAAVWGELAEVIADISVSAAVGNPPLEVVFDGSGSIVINGPATYDWDFGDGNTNSGVVVTNTYVSDGVYTATLTVSDALGNSNSTTTVIESYYMPENVVYSSSKPATPPAVSSMDLGQTAFLSVTNTGVWDDARAYPDTALFDGAVGTTGTWFHTDASVTIAFDTSAYTLGYDISRIDTVFGGNAGAGGRANQGYSVTVTYMDDSTEKILGKKTWEPNSPASFWTKVSFSNSVGGVIASGVKAVTFAEFDAAGAAGFGDYTIACEFDIFGVGTEPTDGPTLGITAGSLVWTTPTVKDYDVEYRELLDQGDWGIYTNVTSTPPETSVELPIGRYDAEFFRVIESE